MSKWWCHLFRWSSLLEKSHRKAGKLAFQTKKLFRIPVSNVSRSLPIHSGTGGGPIFPLFHRSKGGQGAQQFLALLVPRDPVAQPCPTKSMPRFTSLLTWRSFAGSWFTRNDVLTSKLLDVEISGAPWGTTCSDKPIAGS